YGVQNCGCFWLSRFVQILWLGLGGRTVWAFEFGAPLYIGSGLGDTRPRHFPVGYLDIGGNQKVFFISVMPATTKQRQKQNAGENEGDELALVHRILLGSNRRRGCFEGGRILNERSSKR